MAGMVFQQGCWSYRDAAVAVMLVLSSLQMRRRCRMAPACGSGSCSQVTDLKMTPLHSSLPQALGHRGRGCPGCNVAGRTGCWRLWEGSRKDTWSKVICFRGECSQRPLCLQEAWEETYHHNK